MVNAKPISTPMVSSPTLTSMVGTPLYDGTKYSQIVEELQFLCLTQLDFIFSINKVSQYMRQPHDIH